MFGDTAVGSNSDPITAIPATTQSKNVSRHPEDTKRSHSPSVVNAGVQCSSCAFHASAGAMPNRVFFFPPPLFFPAKQAAVHMTESGSPSRWARPALSPAGGGSGQLAQRAPARGPSQVRAQRRLWRPATALSGPCRQRRAALQSTACPTTCVSRQWRQQLGGLVAHGEPGPGRAVGSRRSSALLVSAYTMVYQYVGLAVANRRCRTVAAITNIFY